MSAASKQRSLPVAWACTVASVYRQIIDQVASGIAASALAGGDQLPTVRQLAVDQQSIEHGHPGLSRTEIRGRAGNSGVPGRSSATAITTDGTERQRRLSGLVGELAARAGSEGFTVEELIEQLQDLRKDAGRKRR
jgi:GntR family transcriptional regulator